MCQVNGEGSFSAHLGLQNPWTDSPSLSIQRRVVTRYCWILKFSSLITSPVRPDTQNMVAAENAEWGGHMGEVVPSRAFFSFFGFFNVHSLYWISAQCTQNLFRWWECSFGVGLPRGQIFLFYRRKKNSMGRQTWWSKFGNKSRPVIDGCCDEKSIADQFFSRYVYLTL